LLYNSTQCYSLDISALGVGAIPGSWKQFFNFIGEEVNS